MNIVFLGTAGMVPTKDRNVQSIYIDYNGSGILLDCGEGTQRQMQLANLNAQKIKIILISHWHGDHVAGLVGLIQTIGNFAHDVEKKITLYGPPGTIEFFHHLMNSCVFETKIHIEVKELAPKGVESFYETDDYILSSAMLDHSIPTLGFRFEHKEKRKMDKAKLEAKGISPGPQVAELQAGKNIQVGDAEVRPEDVSTLKPARALAFIFDTQLTDNCFALADHSDIVVSEAVYKHDLLDKAREYKHMTATQAAQVASQVGAQQLILTHFSQRYKDVTELEEEAKTIFPETTCAYDLMKVKPKF